MAEKRSEMQVELRSDSPTHHEALLRAAFAVLERGPLVDLRNVTIPHLASLLRHGTPIPIHNGQGTILMLMIDPKSQLAGSAISWQNNTLHGTTAFAAELPAGQPATSQVDRYVRAVLAAARTP